MLQWQIVPRNALEEAIAVFGGINDLADALKVSRPAVYSWIELGYVPKRDKALALSEKLLRKGHPISAARLMALDEAGDRERDGEKTGRAHRRGRAFQKKVTKVVSVVEPVHRGEPPVREMGAVERRRQLRIAMVQCSTHVLQGFAAGEQRRREAVAQTVRRHALRQTG
jgi:hypothetical protein